MKAVFFWWEFLWKILFKAGLELLNMNSKILFHENKQGFGGW